MVKKIICSLLLFFFIVPVFVYASVNPSVRIGNKYYDNLEDAIQARIEAEIKYFGAYRNTNEYNGDNK